MSERRPPDAVGPPAPPASAHRAPDPAGPPAPPASERLRLFVALDLPAQARVALAAWADRVAPAEVRRVPTENLHVTLAFLGSRSAQEAATVAALLPGLSGACRLGALATAGALWLPPRRPGVLAVALIGEQQLAALHAEVVAALADAIGYEPERRVLRPHVTVGRVRRGTRVRAAAPDPPPLSFHAPALTLYRSLTGPGGARYERLAGALLDPASGSTRNRS